MSSIQCFLDFMQSMMSMESTARGEEQEPMQAEVRGETYCVSWDMNTYLRTESYFLYQWCLGQGFTVVNRHHDQGNYYKDNI